MLTKEKEDVEERVSRVKDILPQLEKIKEQTSAQEAEVYIGIAGIRSAYERLFENVEEKEEALFIYMYKEKYKEQSDRLYLSIRHLFEKLPKKTRGIASPNYKHSPVVEQFADNLNIRYTQEPLPGNIDVYQDKVLQISWEGEKVAVLIHNKEIADTFSEYFEAMWISG